MCGVGLFTEGWYGVCGVHWGLKAGEEAVGRGVSKKRWFGRWCARLRLSEVCQEFLRIQGPWVLLKISVFKDWYDQPSSRKGRCFS